MKSVWIYSIATLASGCFSLERSNNERITRKRSDAEKNIGRQYIETLWESIDGVPDSKELEPGRLLFLESMMSMVMSFPTGIPKPTKPTFQPAIIPNIQPAVLPPAMDSIFPTKEPSLATKGPTLPTRIHIPTNAPVTMPSQRPPIEEPTASSPPTPKITNAPTIRCLESEKEDCLIDVLSTVTKKSILLDPETPQGMAYLFILNEVPSFVGANTVLQRYGLSTVYFSTGGPRWTNNNGWLDSSQECDWFGVQCDDDLNLVTSLTLGVNNLIGFIPDEISTLATLHEVVLFSNSLTGTIPSGLASLENIVTIDLRENLLSGLAFPSFITGLSRLESYRVSKNQLAGEIPLRIGSMRSINILWADNNSIFGTIPSTIGELRDLKSLILSRNDLTGSIPSALGLITLETLALNDNALLGSIPSSLFDLASLRTFRLEGNFLVGTLPMLIGQLTSIVDFRLQNNNLSGSIPTTISFMTSLVSLRLNDNFWTGSIPDAFENYSNLDFFDISNTMLTGTIPTTLFSIPTIRLIYMSKCMLRGSIPPQYADPPILRDLYIDSNELSGTIPSIKPSQLQRLNEFLLQDNKLTGSVPSSICNLRTNSILDDLWTDCGGENPEIECDFPECCNRCFELDPLTTSRKVQSTVEHIFNKT
jgi:Leucine-rich repeat (LRR) protein